MIKLILLSLVLASVGTCNVGCSTTQKFQPDPAACLALLAQEPVIQAEILQCTGVQVKPMPVQVP